MTHTRVFWSSFWLLWFATAFSAAVALLRLSNPLLVLLIYDRVLTSRSVETLVALVGLAVVLLILGGVLDYSRRRLLARFGARIQADLEDALVLSGMPMPDERGIRNLGTENLDALRAFLHSSALVDLIDALWVPLFLGTVFLISPSLGWVASLGLLALLALHGLGRIFSAAPLRDADLASQRASALSSNLRRGQRVLASQRAMPAARVAWKRTRVESRRRTVAVRDRVGLFFSVQTTLQWVFQSLVLGIGAALVLQAELTLGGLVACVILLARVFSPTVAALNALPALGQARVNWMRLGGQIEEIEGRQLMSPAILSSDAPLLEAIGIDLCSDLESVPALRDIRLTVTPGEVVEVKGASASGKTLLCEALVGLRAPTAGRVLLLGHRLDSLLDEAVVPLIGYVPEVPSFMPGTIAAAISGGEAEVATDRVVEAALHASLHARVLPLPEGYSTKLASNGAPLSRGDRHLLALARALYRRPRLLVLDSPGDPLLGSFREDRSGFVAAHLAARGSFLVFDRSFLALANGATRYTLSDGRLVRVSATVEGDNAPAVLRTAVRTSQT